MTIISVKNNKYTADPVYQWDLNRELEIRGLSLPSIPEIHFANGRMSKAIVKQATLSNDGAIKVTIPNILLQTASPMSVYICEWNGEEFISRYSLSINVKARPKPEDYIADDEEKIYSYNALENLINNTLVALREEILSEVDEKCRDAVAEMRQIIDTTTIADADKLDGHHAEEFVLESKPGTTVFNPDGSITTIYTDGSKETTVFNNDGSITTTRNTLGLGVKTETTRFNADGSITVTVG